MKIRKDEVVKACFGFLTLVNINLIWVFAGTEVDIRMVANDVFVTVQASPVTFALHAPMVGVT